MTAHRSLVVAIEFAGGKRDQALEQVQKARQADAFAQNQMQQLRQYAQETEVRWLQAAQRGTSPELLQHHYQFMHRLNQAIVLQEDVLAATGQRVQSAKNALLQAEFRLASFKQVLAVRQAVLARTQQRREQKQMDEFAALQTLRHRQIQAEYPS